MAAILLAGALLAPAAWGAQERPELVPVPEPAIGNFEHVDQEQLTSVRAELDALLAQEDAGGDELAEAFGRVGSLYFLYDLGDAAGAAFTNACALQPGAFAWPYYLGALRQRNGSLEEAKESLERALELRPGDLPTLLRLGNVDFDLGELDAAEERFQAALAASAEGSAERAAALDGLGRIAFEQGDAKTAIERLEAALALQPEATAIHHQLGLAYRDQGDLDRAREHLLLNRHDPVRFPDPLIDRLNTLVLGSSIHLKRGNMALEAGDTEAAIEEYRRARELAPDDPLTWYNLGFVLVRTGARSEAIPLFEKAIELDPDYRNAHYNLATALAEEGRWPEAAAHYGEAFRIDPLDHQAHLEWALALLRAGDAAAAGRELERLLADVDLRNSPFEGRVRLYLGQLRERAGDTAGAVELYREAVALAPDLQEAHATLARTLGRVGRFEDAAAAYQGAVDLDPDDVEARFGQAMALMLAGDLAAARGRLEAGLEAVPSSIPLAHLLARLLATAPDPAVRDGERAVALARRVLDADRSLEHAETLAMALAEAGRFEEATEVERRAVASAEGAGLAAEAARGRRWLALYEAGQAVRSPWRQP